MVVNNNISKKLMYEIKVLVDFKEVMFFNWVVDQSYDKRRPN